MSVRPIRSKLNRSFAGWMKSKDRENFIHGCLVTMCISRRDLFKHFTEINQQQMGDIKERQWAYAESGKIEKKIHLVPTYVLFDEIRRRGENGYHVKKRKLWAKDGYYFKGNGDIDL